MTEDEVLNEIMETRQRKVGKNHVLADYRVISPAKLAAFLAKHLALHAPEVTDSAGTVSHSPNIPSGGFNPPTGHN